jgi:hypothetical protein
MQYLEILELEESRMWKFSSPEMTHEREPSSFQGVLSAHRSSHTVGGTTEMRAEDLASDPDADESPRYDHLREEVDHA